MAKSRAPSPPQKFETKGGKGGFVRLYDDLLFSVAFNSLTPGARTLYMFFLYARYHQTSEEKAYLAQKYGNTDHTYLFFNESRWQDTPNHKRDSMHYCIYPVGGGRQFRRDKNALIDKGFLEVIEQNSHRMAKNVYRLSSKWQDY